MYYLLDVNGFETSRVRDALVTAETPVTDHYDPTTTQHTQTAPPAGLIKPKWNGSAWVEDATAQEQTDSVDTYREHCRAACYTKCQDKMIEIHGSVQAMFEHAAKWREANTVKNVAGKAPVALRDEAGTSDTPYIDEYVLEFGGTDDDAATAIIAAEWVDAQRGAKIARYRVRCTTDLDAATDKAGVDTAMTNLDTNLATI